MDRKEVYDSLDNDLAVRYTIGAFVFDDETDKGKKPITIEKAREYKTETLEAVIVFLTYDDEIDFEVNYVALDTVMNICSVLVERKEEKGGVSDG